MDPFQATPALTVPRRATLLGLASILTLGRVSLAMADAPTEQRFVVVILRGAMDGLSAVVPYGDPGLEALRPELVPPMPGQDQGLLDLGGKFGLHPAMTRAHALYQANELLVVHAVAGNYRVRSHFEAQDYLESGADHRMTSGWLNRAVAAMPATGRPHAISRAIAVGPSVPLLLRGHQQVANWAPHGFAEPDQTLYRQVLSLNRSDPLIGPAIAAGLRDRGFGDEVMNADKDAQGGNAGGPGKAAPRYAFATLATAAGDLLKAPDGPRIAAMDLGGWDTHTAQVPRLTQALTQLDTGIDALRTALGEAWGQTVVLVMTEFGRTARMNGTRGTDHGTATVAFLAGGAVAGGRVVANWPGLASGQLFENRDLAPTTDLRSVAQGILLAHLGLDPAALSTVFPGGEPAQPLRGLVRAA
jgi:uncharacterized protein (DUF1501 family)